MNDKSPFLFNLVKSLNWNHRELFPSLFGDNDRIVLPYVIDKKKLDTYKRVQRIRQHVEKKVDGITEFDYLKGTIVSRKQKMKIGKMIKDSKQLSKTFQKDPLRVGEKLKIVISRDPYDIVSMSSNRSWASCMTIDTITMSQCAISTTAQKLIETVTEGALIAYLVRENDMNLRDPLSRVLIKPYRSLDKHICYITSKVYGLPNSLFKQQVNKWVKANLPRPKKDRLYRPRVYRELRDPEIVCVSTSIIREKNPFGIKYFLNSKLHRENGPAHVFINPQGERCKEYYVNGRHHRIGGPAIVYGHKHKEWIVNDEYHRENGPAIIMNQGEPDEYREYWINGKEVAEEKFQTALDTMKIGKL